MLIKDLVVALLALPQNEKIAIHWTDEPGTRFEVFVPHEFKNPPGSFLMPEGWYLGASKPVATPVVPKALTPSSTFSKRK